MKILAADDDPIVLELLARFLSAVGQHDLTTACCAHDVIELTTQEKATKFDCFLFDIQMCGMSGVELAHHIRQTSFHASTPIVMLTALTGKRYIDGAFAAGATDYISKPFDLTEFATRIGIIEQLVLSRRATAGTAGRPLRLRPGPTAQKIDLSQPITIEGIDTVIAYEAMENYTAQLSRSSLFGSTVFAFGLRKPERYCSNLPASEFRSLITGVAKAVCDALSGPHFLMAYAGNGIFLCITRSGYHPDMAHLEDQVNLRLNSAQVMCSKGTDLNPRVSAGVAIRLVWKSGERIPRALISAQQTALRAAAEHERLNTDSFQLGRSA